MKKAVTKTLYRTAPAKSLYRTDRNFRTMLGKFRTISLSRYMLLVFSELVLSCYVGINTKITDKYSISCRIYAIPDDTLVHFLLPVRKDCVQMFRYFEYLVCMQNNMTHFPHILMVIEKYVCRLCICGLLKSWEIHGKPKRLH